MCTEDTCHANHGDFALLHCEMLNQFNTWRDEFFEREFGWKLSKLLEMEKLVAMFTTSTSLTPEGVAERDRVVEEYIRVWRPRRMLLQERL